MGDHFDAAASSMRAVGSAAVAALVLALGSSCAESRAGRMAQHAAFARAPAIEIRAPKGPLFEQAERLASRVSEALHKRVDVREPATAGDRAAVRIVVGTVDEPRIAALAAPLGVEALAPDGAAGRGFRLFEREYRAPSDALVATFEDPDRPGRPFVLVAGVEAAAFAPRLDDLPAPWIPRLATWRAGAPAVDVELTRIGEPILETLLDRSAGRERRWASVARIEFDGFTLVAGSDADPERTLAYGQSAQSAVRNVRRWLGAGDVESDPLEVFVHGDAEHFEAELGLVALERVDRASLRVDALVAAGLPHDGGAGVARATALALRGDAAEAWLEDGVAIAAADQWWGVPLETWLSHLSGTRPFAGLDPTRGGADAPSVSEHVLLPKRAQRVMRAIAAGADLAAAWRGERALEPGGADTIADVGEEWRAEQAERRRRAISEARRGVALFGSYARPALESHSVYSSLLAAKRLGANAFSVTVQAASKAPRTRLLPRERTTGTSSDVALACAIAAGKRLEMSPLLVVEPLQAPWGTWEDTGLFAPEESIEEFFERVRGIVTHYALLAELCRVETLSLGAGFDKSSRTIETGDELEEGLRVKEVGRREWSALIAHVRALFGGALTCANRGVLEAKRIGHWDELDLVGAHVFDSLTDGGELEASDATVSEAIEAQLSRGRAIASRWGKPLAVLQLGFPATATSWRDPSVPTGPFDPAAQERFYRLLAGWLESAEPEELPLGLYLWNWDTRDPRGRTSVYSLRGRPAQAHLETILRAR